MNSPAIARKISPAEQRANDAARKLYREIERTMIYLYGRWQDEHEYEEIADYAKPLKEACDKAGATDIHMTKRPFGFRCNIGGFKYEFAMTATKYTLRRSKA